MTKDEVDSVLYPLIMKPYFRHDEETPWGGTSFRDFFGKDIPSEVTGESLEVSSLPGLESTVSNGELEGKSLGEVVGLWGSDLTGLPECEGFPLLVKILDAREKLSVQVHPGDAYSMEKHGKLGKSEAWVILSAQPGAGIVYGISEGDGFEDAVRSEKIESCLRWRTVYPGEVYYIPNGLVHAMGAGVVAYEIQQSSDATYRFWDYGRTGPDGRPRELHTEDALNVTRPELRLSKVAGATYLTEGGSVTAYVSEPHFELVRLNLAGRMPVSGGRIRMLTPLYECTLLYPGGEMPLSTGETALIPAALEGVALVGRAPVLLSTTPDPQKLIRELSYRASDVAGLTEGV